MQRIDGPPLEMADIVRYAGPSFAERSRRWITWQHQKVLLAITRCRTAALGGHRDRRAASFKSLYPQRPERAACTTDTAAGAADT